MSLTSRRLLALLFLLTAACGDDDFSSDASVDASLDADPGQGRMLTLETSTSITLRAQETSTIEVRLWEEGAPVAATPVSFALVGVANDSSLTELEVRTDASGRAQTTIEAGSAVGSFRVRVSAERSTPLSVDVSVGDSGFGNIDFSLEYAGDREGTLSASFHVVASCDDERTRLDRSRSMEGATGSFVAVPAGASVAVAGRLDGTTLLAWGCVDDIVLAHDETREVTVVLEDFMLEVTGLYDLHLGVEATRVQETLEAALDPITADTNIVSSYLDAYHASVLEEDRERFEINRGAIAEALAEEAALWLAGQSVQTSLAAVGEDALTDLEVSGELRIATEAVDFAFESASLGVTPQTMLSLDDHEDTLRAAWDATTEALLISGLEIGLSAADLWTASWNRALLASDAADSSSWFAAALSCEEAPSVPDYACEAGTSCSELACQALVTELEYQVAQSMAALAEAHPHILVQGEVPLRDTDADRVIDHGEATLSGDWGAAYPIAATVILSRRTAESQQTGGSSED